MPQDILNIVLFIVASHICVSIFCVYIGIQIGKSIGLVPDSVKHKKQNKELNKDLQSINSIQIDEKKVVLDINTESLTKKFDTLAQKKETNENISNSINKLKSMKG